MIADDIEYCSQMIAQEERKAEEAPSREAGCVHLQIAMLYKAELAALLRKYPERSAETLAQAWPSCREAQFLEAA